VDNSLPETFQKEITFEFEKGYQRKFFDDSDYFLEKLKVRV